VNQAAELSKPLSRMGGLWAGLALAWALVSVVGHLPFSIWLVSQRAGASGTWAFKDAVPHVTVLAALGLCLWVGWQSRAASAARLRWVGLSWVLWLTCCFMVDRWLTFTVNEYAHYPQYALLAWLWARALDGDRSRWPVLRVVLITTLLGAVDETVQYLWTTRSYSHYLDFNDWLVNGLAAWAGVMLFYGFREPPVLGPLRLRSRAAWAALGFGLALWAVLSACGCVRVSPDAGVLVAPGGMGQKVLYLQRAEGWYGHWHPGPRHGRYWVIHPLPALGLLALGMLGVAGFARKTSGSGGLGRLPAAHAQHGGGQHVADDLKP
jgi:VanZ family protein